MLHEVQNENKILHSETIVTLSRLRSTYIRIGESTVMVGEKNRSQYFAGVSRFKIT